MKKALEFVFWLALVAFLALGALIVFGQLLGVVVLSPGLVEGAAAALNWSAFSSATVCALAAFALQYLPEEKSTEQP
ncbi:hypothetical protein SAMN05421805_102350 [Saccharopolyspora antimicrobica]|uniref:Uncharacterized protein n=1 Tax=Saccharopolyspora antimicrobica TaxID=455193 RepID=A0A1I4VRQ9_9PSEU|nr:hypothetical protein [Saccharopolyspora antimicrobica]RKT87237.1 hypothetical protein ATL45_5637 [Saccharopolyspora antimicrobica]SFN03958.1 hypothetical protein SAMN05421805_102350 [Saccharopolyspora antimicrobica]